MLQAINNNHLLGCPGLTTANVTKYLQETTATAKGHLNQHKKNIQSTKNVQQILHDNDTVSIPVVCRTHQVLATLVDHTNNKAYFDLAGPFPYVSKRGYKYIFVLYDYDSNAILTLPLKSGNSLEMKNAWITLHNKLIKNNITPKTYIMDKETNAELKQTILKYKINYQLTPPHIHQINAAERAIRTYKNHFLAGLASVDPTFPINGWDRLLLQAKITLNLLRISRINPNLSAYAVLNGNYDFNKHLMAPPGTKVIVHTKPAKRPA